MVMLYILVTSFCDFVQAKDQYKQKDFIENDLHLENMNKKYSEAEPTPG